MAAVVLAVDLVLERASVEDSVLVVVKEVAKAAGLAVVREVVSVVVREGVRVVVGASRCMYLLEKPTYYRPGEPSSDHGRRIEHLLQGISNNSLS